MNITRYTLNQFLTNNHRAQIIIPEIQRDYVWKEDNVKNFLQSMFENSQRQNNSFQGIPQKTLNKLSHEMSETILRIEKEKQICFNIGFISAYFDYEIPDQYILIDGQQRMTTLFLILLALSVKEGKQDHFRKLYFKDNILKLDYRIRYEAHQFLLNFVEYILDGNGIENISNKYWNFSEYKNDTTIQSIITNYKVIWDFIDNHNLLLDYVENYIEFWYFDTGKSQQGEELYLYINDRGKIISQNEIFKTNLLKGLSDEEKNKGSLLF